MVRDFMPKIQKSKNCLFVNLPAQYCRLLGWKKGTELVIYPGTEKGTLLMKEMPKKKPSSE